MYESTAPAAIQNLRAVIAEDELLLQVIMKDLLQDEGFEVEIFGTADAALEYLEANRDMTNIVISNVRMPGTIDGIRLSQIVKERWPTLPIILVSAYTGIQKDLPVGVPFLHKPWSVDQLISAVIKAVPRPSY